MFSFFKKKPAEAPKPSIFIPDLSFLTGDMHSHLVPGIDDGSQSLADSEEFIKSLYRLGLKKIITTPHIHGEMYDNDTQKVQAAFEPLKTHMAAVLPDLHLQVSAEYFLDNYFLEQVLPNGLMPFGDNQVLVEVSMAGRNRRFDEIIFAVQANGYKPILAHPERYIYETDFAFFERLKQKGVTLQLNLLSLLGYYGRTIKQHAEVMLERKLFDYCGTDLHHDRHLAHFVQMAEKNQEILWQLSEYGFKNADLYP